MFSVAELSISNILIVSAFRLILKGIHNFYILNETPCRYIIAVFCFSIAFLYTYVSPGVVEMLINFHIFHVNQVITVVLDQKMASTVLA